MSTEQNNTPEEVTTPDGLKVYDSSRGLVVMAYEHNQSMASARAEVEAAQQEANQFKGIAKDRLAQLATAKEERAKLESDNLAEWSTLMADIHDYYKDERADRSRSRVTLVLTLLGNMRCQRDEALLQWKRNIEEHDKIHQALAADLAKANAPAPTSA